MGIFKDIFGQEEWVRKAYKRSLAKYHPDKATTHGASVATV